MRSNYPLSSQELNDKILGNYEHLVYLNGVELDGVITSGLYDRIEASGLNLLTMNSGIPYIPTNYQGFIDDQYVPAHITDTLKWDYIYKKVTEQFNE